MDMDLCISIRLGVQLRWSWIRFALFVLQTFDAYGVN